MSFFGKAILILSFPSFIRDNSNGWKNLEREYAVLVNNAVLLQQGNVWPHTIRHKKPKLEAMLLNFYRTHHTVFGVLEPELRTRTES